MTDERFPAPTSANPLMQPVQYNGQTYYTSQYFHAQYLASHQETAKKYHRHKHFVRLIRNIEGYALYTDGGDIVELAYDKEGAHSRNPHMVPLWKSTAYNPIMLLNAKAQLELIHHLDDELSKQMAYAVNTKVARDAHSSGSILLQVKDDLVSWLAMAVICDAPKYIALIEAGKYIERTYGIDIRPMLQLSTAMDAIPAEDVMLEPTELGKKLGNLSPQTINHLLARIGWQQKINGSWEPTLIGKQYSTPHAWISEHGTKSGYNLKWNLAAVQSIVQKHEIVVEED